MVDKVTFRIELDLEDVKASERKNIKDDIGEFLIEAIKADAQSGKSPVTGRNFKQLTKKYADKAKGGNRLANLTLTEDMLNSLEYRRTVDGIEIGIFDSTEAKKADNHNKFSAESLTTPVPRRPFIPSLDRGENFRPGIREELNLIMDIYKEASSGDES